MVQQYSISIGPFPYGFHLITDLVVKKDIVLPETGLFHAFIQHTSAGITVNENADGDVLHDFRLFFDPLAPEDMPGLHHTIEGPDDMPAHIKATLTGSSVTIPITQHRLNLGTWQGIYLCEFRKHARVRTLVVTIYS
jgi:secondary thiamine-phosphate synthase enzyme